MTRLGTLWADSSEGVGFLQFEYNYMVFSFPFSLIKPSHVIQTFHLSTLQLSSIPRYLQVHDPQSTWPCALLSVETHTPDTVSKSSQP